VVSNSVEESEVMSSGLLSIFKYVTKILSDTDLSLGEEPQALLKSSRVLLLSAARICLVMLFCSHFSY